MKHIVPDISVNNCEQALEFYKDVLGGEPKNVQKAGAEGMFAAHAGKIMHAELHINERSVLYFHDPMGGAGSIEGINVLLEMDNKEEIDRVYAALSKDGTVHFELQKTFWGAYHAVVTDRFGVPWELNCAIS